jgi:uncharacterized membrane protein
MRISGIATLFGTGALAMYFFDAERGGSRRAMVMDKLQSAHNELNELMDDASRDAGGRVQGFIAALRSRLAASDVAPEKLAQRVRSRIGRAVSNAGALEVRVDGDRVVSISGPLLRREQNHLLATIWLTPGVARVENHLELHDEIGNVPGLQGADASRSAFTRESWPASVRVLAGAAGGTAAAYGLVRGGPRGLLAIALGGALLARAASNQPLARVVGLDGTNSVHIDKDLFIAAPADRVIACWRAPEDFPRFMRNVLEVQPKGAGRWHWKVAGPAGSVVEWEAENTQDDDGRHITWRTIAGSLVQHQGSVDIEPQEEGTRLRLSMDYTPVAGIIGHSAARLFGKDAKTILDEDLMRLKTFLETGTPAHDAARSTSAQEKPVGPLH